MTVAARVLRPLRRPPAAESLGLGLAVLLFGLSVRGRPLPTAIAALSLLGASVLLVRALWAPDGVTAAFGTSPGPRRLTLWFMLAAAFGQALAMYWRWASGAAMLPTQFTAFILIAAAIGATEELVFRGFVQGSIWPQSPAGAIVAAATLHAAYKAAIFICPAPGENVSIAVLFAGTLAGGIVFGAMRQVSGSVWPCVVAHAVFDIIGYGDRLAAPSWIWH